jgi:two-component system catabolic regulation response regulator CreB
MEAGWEDPGASLDRTVDAHIKTLRAKLRVAAPDDDLIQTHRGLGYSLRSARVTS